MKILFDPGLVRMTEGCQEAFRKTAKGYNLCGKVVELYGEFLPFLERHLSGDWGDLEYEEDRDANDASVHTGRRLLSEYHLSDGTRIWVITEGDRSATMFLLPEEY